MRSRDYKSAQCGTHVQASDNTRHRSVNPSTGEPFLLPARDIRRVVLCTGQVYYHLSRSRRARRIRDIVLVRLEQIAPFPSDLLIKVCSMYRRLDCVTALRCSAQPLRGQLRSSSRHVHATRLAYCNDLQRAQRA